MKEIFRFLRDLQKNNNRVWFQENKDRYLVAKTTFETFIDEVITGISKFDPDVTGIRAKDSIFRIYRDTRFSANKTPYKDHMGAFIAKGGKTSQRGGYYIHLEPGGSLFAGGIWCLDSPILKALRKDVYDNIEEFKSIVENPDFTRYYEMDKEDMLKKVPAPFLADFPDGEWLRMKKYICSGKVPDNFFEGKDIVERSRQRLELILPLNRFVNYTIDESMQI